MNRPARVTRSWVSKLPGGPGKKRSVRMAVSAVVLALAGTGAAALAGVFTAAPEASAAVQADPVSAAVIHAMTADTSLKITPSNTTAAASRATSKAAAEQAALSNLAAPAGSKVLGAALAYANSPRYANQLVWLVSLNPAGGLSRVSGGPAGVSSHAAPLSDNFVVAIVSATNGKWLETVAGHSPNLPNLPAIPG